MRMNGKDVVDIADLEGIDAKEYHRYMVTAAMTMVPLNSQTKQTRKLLMILFNDNRFL